MVWLLSLNIHKWPKCPKYTVIIYLNSVLNSILHESIGIQFPHFQSIALTHNIFDGRQFIFDSVSSMKQDWISIILIFTYTNHCLVLNSYRFMYKYDHTKMRKLIFMCTNYIVCRIKYEHFEIRNHPTESNKYQKEFQLKSSIISVPSNRLVFAGQPINVKLGVEIEIRNPSDQSLCEWVKAMF